MWKEQKHELLTRESKTIYIHTYTHFPCFPPAPALPTWSGLGARRSEQVRNIIYTAATHRGFQTKATSKCKQGRVLQKQDVNVRYWNTTAPNHCFGRNSWREKIQGLKKIKNLGTSSNSKRKRKWPILRGFLINGIFSIATGTMTGSFSNFVQSK